jgi:molybdate transport system substrate-binding protein
VDLRSVTATTLDQALGAASGTDVVIQSTDVMERLVREGSVTAGTAVAFARAGIGVAVRTNAPTPDIATTDAFRRALLAARSVAHSRGASGLYIASLIERLGIAEAMRTRTVIVENEPVAVAVARGDAELGLQQINVITPVPGVDYAGPLPPELQHFVVFLAAPLPRSRRLDAARELIRFIASPATAPLIARTMEPVSR